MIENNYEPATPEWLTIEFLREWSKGNSRSWSNIAKMTTLTWKETVGAEKVLDRKKAAEAQARAIGADAAEIAKIKFSRPLIKVGPKFYIKNWLSGIKLIDAEIVESGPIAGLNLDVTRTLKIKARYRIRKIRPELRTGTEERNAFFYINLLNETAPYRAGKGGKWGILPPSFRIEHI